VARRGSGSAAAPPARCATTTSPGHGSAWPSWPPTPIVSINELIENETGLLVDGGALPAFFGNGVCRNGTDLDLRGEDVFPEAENVNPICAGDEGS